jgi:hypothetical protein
MRSREGHALQVGRALHAREREHRGREVHEMHRRGDARAGRGGREVAPLRREVDDQRDVRPAPMQEALAARRDAAVVAVVEDDRVAGDARLFQRLQLEAALAVHLGDAVVLAGEVGAHLRRVGLVRPHAHFGGISGRHLRAAPVVREKAALVRHLVVVDAEERRAGRRPVFPLRLPAARVPGLFHVDGRVVVRLRVVGRVIARPPQIGREALEKSRDLAGGAHVVGGAAHRRVKAGDEGEARGRADGHRVAALEDDALAGQRVEVRRAGQGVAVAPEEGAVVLAHEAQDVGAFLTALARLRAPGNQQDGDGPDHAPPNECLPRQSSHHTPHRLQLAISSLTGRNVCHTCGLPAGICRRMAS